MQYDYRLSREAETDILNSYIWYEDQRHGLGEEFLDQLSIARDFILKNPLANKIRIRKEVRGYVTKRFPYIILYVVNENNIDVIAVFNTSRDPDILEKRT